MTETVTPDTVLVSLVEDDDATREGLRILLDGSHGTRCMGAFASLEEALPELERDRPHVLLLDIQLPGVPGTEGVRIVKQRWPSIEILMLTVYGERENIFESVCNGASGYLLKNTPPARLLEAIREVTSGGAPMSPEIARKIVTLFRKTPPPDTEERRLTSQEVRLLQLLAEGHSYQAVGAQLNVSVNTVRNYVRSVYDKLHVHSRSEAVSKALRKGLIA